MTEYEQMYAQPVENLVQAPARGATTPEPSQRSLIWARLRELGEAVMAGPDQFAIVDQAREMVDILRGLDEWSLGPDWMRSVPMVALNDHQVALIYSLVLLALVQKTESTTDLPGEPRYGDVRDHWLEATADDLEEIRARLAEVWGSRLEQAFG